MYKTSLRHVLVIFATGIILGSCAQQGAQKNEEFGLALRAPAYPLVTIDPYTSAWSTSDQLYDSPVKHWTGTTHSMIGAVRVDGKIYRFLGKEEPVFETVLPAADEWAGQVRRSRLRAARA